MSLGLTQPLDRKQAEQEKAAGKSYSSFGFELAFLTQDRAAWASEALYLLVSHITEGVEVKWGDRFAFGFSRKQDGKLTVFTGAPEEVGHEPFGSIRALLFWPYLFPDANFITSTGKAMIMLATGITADEWELAKQTTTAQLLLLLCRAGVCQRTDLQRTSVLADDRWRMQWKEIEAMGGEKADSELEAGIGRWYDR